MPRNIGNTERQRHRARREVTRSDDRKERSGMRTEKGEGQREKSGFSKDFIEELDGPSPVGSLSWPLRLRPSRGPVRVSLPVSPPRSPRRLSAASNPFVLRRIKALRVVQIWRAMIVDDVSGSCASPRLRPCCPGARDD
ncbi:hypothetical protein SKAU_G00269530 [Synaphobranchus kaupii]|uniref:Uncharacterized protein n=1 Tax=Synaphobranchus kaupii TaxID=118154 RepID=A0A9Q1F0B2_SYNKA|nr:hypothetical protein SKAU_G00269530 [Synaphobranchus kaupii]